MIRLAETRLAVEVAHDLPNRMEEGLERDPFDLVVVCFVNRNFFFLGALAQVTKDSRLPYAIRPATEHDITSGLIRQLLSRRNIPGRCIRGGLLALFDGLILFSRLGLPRPPAHAIDGLKLLVSKALSEKHLLEKSFERGLFSFAKLETRRKWKWACYFVPGS